MAVQELKDWYISGKLPKHYISLRAGNHYQHKLMSECKDIAYFSKLVGTTHYTVKINSMSEDNNGINLFYTCPVSGEPRSTNVNPAMYVYVFLN